MKLLVVNNNHIHKKEVDYEYGCVCGRCGSVFLFDLSEASSLVKSNSSMFNIGLMTGHNMSIGTVTCPNCQNENELTSCIKFNSRTEMEQFKSLYDE